MRDTREPYKRRNPDTDKMNLPDDKVCKDCFHFKRCNAIYGHIAEDAVCDWSPSRFKDAS
jgi:hypothetical protein